MTFRFDCFFYRVVAIAALIFLALSGVVGSIPLITNPTGEPWNMPQSLLQYSPFHSYRVPGIILLIANGLLSLWVLRLTVSKLPGFGCWVIVQGTVLLGWLIVEVAMLRLLVWPHYLYGAVAIALLISGTAIVCAKGRKEAAL
jgi:hypothetical protein